MEHDNRPVKVEFPSKMKVTSPELDSINSTSQRISNWLHNDLKNIIEPLTVVKFIPDMLKALSQTIVQQFSNLLMGQVEGDVINRQANIKVLNRKIGSTQKHIQQKEENLNNTINRVTDRYTSLSEQLNKEHETFLRKLDSHAYDIIEKIFPNQIQDKFSYDSLPGIDFLSDHAMVSVVDRNQVLEQGMTDAFGTISSFLEEQNLVYNEVESFDCKELDEGSYEIPWCYVELENRSTGETRLECWFESELEAGEKNSELDLLRQDMETLADNQDNMREEMDHILSNLETEIKAKLPASEHERLAKDLQLV